MKANENNEYHIGLVLAGAVTAGAYTAGVLDYLFNTLILWEKEYEERPNEVPKPNVKIETLTGASAGSIAAAVSLLALSTNKVDFINPGQEPPAGSNLLYDAWVNFGLPQGEDILESIFSADPKKEGEIKSLLNTAFIENLVHNMCKLSTVEQALPNFISGNLDLLFTLSNLRGIPLHLNFSDNSTQVAQSMTYHKAFAHFKLNKSLEDESTLPLNLNDETQLRLFLNCARASGAFPIGLSAVSFEDIPKEYIEANLNKIFGHIKGMVPDLPANYEFTAVDGGMTNNEPIAEALRILKESSIDHNDPQVILIDPFPNYVSHKEVKKYETDESLPNIIGQLFTTLRNQVLFKEKDIAYLFERSETTKMIWPTRYTKKDGKFVGHTNPIASGALGGFSGFFSSEFRKHDYFIGQKNAQNFIRYYFPQNGNNNSWSDEMKEKFSYKDSNGDAQLPIIPDYKITGRANNPRKSFLPKVEDHPNFPELPQINHGDFVQKRLKNLLKTRLNFVIEKTLNSSTESNSRYTNSFPKEYLMSQGLLSMLAPKAWRWITNWFIRRQLLKKVLPIAIDTITESLHDHDLLENNNKPPITVI